MKRATTFLTLLGLLLLTTIALAQSGGGFDLSWSTVDGGGYTFSQGGGYTLGGTVGQPDAGVLSDGSYTLTGGFWPNSGATQHNIYLPVVLRNY
jgi:hypothetical protein